MNWRLRLRRRILPVSTAAKVFDDTGLTKMQGFVAAGFTTLIAVLTFFGVKDGVLQRVVQEEPRQSLLVFCLIGLGLLCGILAYAINNGVKIYLVSVPVAVAALGGLTLRLVKNLPHEGASDDVALAVITVGGTLLLVAMVSIAIGAKIPLSVAVLVVGVTATSMGLYGAAKVSVMSKLSVGEPRVAITAQDGDQPQLTLTVKAVLLGNQKLSYKLVGHRANALFDLGSVVLTPDSLGEIDEAINFPVPASGWTKIEVRQCVSENCDDSPVVTMIRGMGADQPQVSGSIERGDGDAVWKESLRAYGVPAESQLEVSVIRKREGEEPVILKHAMLEPAADGTAEWSSTVIGCQGGDQMVLQYRMCPDGGRCDGERVPIASYLVPRT